MSARDVVRAAVGEHVPEHLTGALIARVAELVNERETAHKSGARIELAKALQAAEDSLNGKLEGQDFEALLVEAYRADGMDPRVQKLVDKYRDEAAAREAIKRERAASEMRLPPNRESYTLRSYMDEPKAPKVERIQGLQRVGHNAALIASYKTGKTTLTANLAKALADGTDFLGQFAVQCPQGRVGFWNAEMDAEDFEDYLLGTKIENPDAVAIWNLRGFRVDILSDTGREAAVEWLKANDVSYWIVDPWARVCAWSQVNENENPEVAPLLQRVHEVADDAGVTEVLLVHHAGIVPGRARGATVFSDNADVLWQYSRDEEDGTRYFRAYGRKIQELHGVIELDDGVTTFKEGSRKAAKMTKHVREVVEYVTEHPGCKRQEVYNHLSVGKGSQKAIVDQAIRLGHLVETQPDGRTKALHVSDHEGLMP